MLGGNIETFNANRFLANLARFSRTSASNLYIKAVVSSSIIVTVGVLPVAVAAVSTAITTHDEETLQEALGVVVQGTPVVTQPTFTPPTAPPTDADDKDGSLVVILCAIGSVVVVGVLVAIWTRLCFSVKRQAVVSLVKMDSAQDRNMEALTASPQFPDRKMERPSMSFSAQI